MTMSRRIFFRMRNVSNKSCRENQHTHFMFSHFFLNIVPFMRQCQKICWSQRGCRWQIEAALRASLVTIHACKYTSAPYASVHTSTRTRARARAHTHTHTHTQKYVRHCFSTGTMVSSARLNVTLYEYCISCFY
jgi:hypothetical protein